MTRMGELEGAKQPPQLIYDDECGFCTWAVAYLIARGDFEPIGFSSLTSDQRDKLPDNYRQCAHVLTDETVLSCGKAMIASAAHLDTPIGYIARAIVRLPGHEYIVETVYRLISTNRHLFGRLRSCDGLDIEN